MTRAKILDNMKRKIKGVHFVGIGGIGMSGIAEVLINLKYRVSGSDVSTTELTERLATLGAAINYGHRPENVGDADVVVTSTAVRMDNPEVREAHRRRIPVVPRAEMLAELLKMKFSVAVSGSHGKTTTTSMIATVLAHAGLDPTLVIGGKLMSIGGNARLGDGEVIVAEADESDGSFLRLSPILAVITNIDYEHVDFYPTISEIKEAFIKFADSVPFYGSCVACGDDEQVKAILPLIKRRVITYGLQGGVEYQAVEVVRDGPSSTFALFHSGRKREVFKLNVPGLFNVYNALAAIATGRELGLSFRSLREGLARFTGVQRRLEVKGGIGDITVVDDYGHHPTEIRATLEAARAVWKGRIVVVFQPHRYSRTSALFSDFVGAFDNADTLIVTDIYPAGEEKIPGVTGESLCQGIREGGHGDCSYGPSFEQIIETLLKRSEPGEVIITLGAGNVWKVGDEFLRKARGGS